ncbi:beta-1,6-N-acetylglucosaminyltransferase [Mucilaginibacter sp. PAMB04168]|uniref:beta-1,6-N-acetylglucosaminyltransferase n=1 Tax=Mucilaginibacter sp. PAMB04168 TaxID=3138567 RepID=UPI0031F6B32D
MRIAHLILAHNNPNQLELLIRRLTYADDVVYVHLDKKTPLAPFGYLRTLKNVFFVDKRVSVKWGASSMVDATINGFTEILATGTKYDFINLLSGCDYPLQRPEYIHDYLSQHKGKTFMSFRAISNDWQEAIPRIELYHLNNYKFPGVFIAQRLLNQLLPKRSMPNALIPVGQSQWFTASGDAVAYILNFWKQNPQLRRFIGLTWGPDEFVFQTILYNSPFYERLVNNNLRYIDWSAGGASPKTLTIADQSKLLASNNLYARKFDLDKHGDIMQLIDQKLGNDSRVASA